MKTFIRTLLPGMAAVICALPLAAETITPQEALRQAMQSSAWKAPSTGGAPVLTYTANTTDLSAPAYYVYNKPQGGFLILSADDELPLVLADVDNGFFSVDALPSNVKWWMGEYVREIDWYLENRDEIKAAAAADPAPRKTRLQAGKENIEPFVHTKWAQDSPYNELCPRTYDDICVTGCVATAMAQAMKRFNYPETGFGENRYADNGLPREFDFGATTFQWDNMLDSYLDGYTPEQAEAVATLMAACGMSVNSNYSPEATGAIALRIPHAYRKYFGYSKVTSFVQRDFTTLTRWVQLIYDEMAAGRPVTYSGVGPAGGHEFIADGYRTGDMFHINWGWNGYCDGYFRLTALNPPGVGIGGGAGAFNTDQDAVVHLCPPGQDEGLYQLTPLYIKGDVGVYELQSSDEEGTVARIIFRDGALYGNIVDDITGKIGVFITDEYGDEVGWYPYGDIQIKGMGTRNWVSGTSFVSVFVPRLEPGKYNIYIGFENEDIPAQIIPVRNGDRQSITMIINEDNEMELSNEGYTMLPVIEVTNILLPPKFYPNLEAPVKLDVTTGESGYNGYLRMHVIDPATQEELLRIPVEANIDPFMLEFVDFTTTLDLEAGNYEIYITDYTDEPVSRTYPIKVGTREESSVGTIGAEGSEAEYFDLQGRRISGTPAPGLYIRRSGTETRKVVIK